MKRSRKILSLAAGLSAIALTLTGCAAGGGAPTGEPSQGENGGDEEYTIAIVTKNATDPWFVRMKEGVEQYAADSGHNVFERGPSDSDATLQVQVIRDLIAQGVDAIGVVPVDPAALEPVLKDAMDAGIVVVTHEGATVENAMYDLEAFSNKAYGEFIMENLAQAMGGEGVYTTMVGGVTISSHNEWADAGVAYQKANYPDMQLLEAQPRVESSDDGEVAYQKAKELFKTYPDLKGIMGTSSYDAPGIARAIEEMGLIGEVFTVGTGLPAANAEILKKGILPGLTLWDPAAAGYALASLAAHVLDGDEITNGLDLGIEGYNDLQFSEGSDKVLEGDAMLSITKENVDSFRF